MSTDLTDIAAPPLTQAGRDYLTKVLDSAWTERAGLTGKRDALLREVASITRVIDCTDRSIAMLQAELDGPVSLLPPMVDLGDDPEGELPLEAAAHAAALAEQSKAGRDPYGPSTLPDLPRALGAVRVPGDFETEPVGGAR
ncbi:hypothetical protein Ssi03_51000 [Sphaerisporangium siamense]|uniref:Uncharacterized protein n=1 Tax=Sphaerisporangium siamense TaxID=795645 RepID=A0A7W7D8V5_9ACTN|nr:hypothetical protein [Sphaerisporangium siamense]MBB4702196.1 hypothetical protein [Sphaerisporangium siamense]GII87110.1 hypothetical protein Ssi03_51000 [Sphaerisporangium siamense]